MKTISILVATAAGLAAAINTAGFPLNVAGMISIACAAGVVALFVHDYSRIRRRFHLRVRRNPSVRGAFRRHALRETMPVRSRTPASLCHCSVCSTQNP